MLECDKCNNSGYIIKTIDGYDTAVKCECFEKRQIIDKLNQCGLTDFLKKKTFNNYIVNCEYEKAAKITTMRYCKTFREQRHSLILAGQSGTGKTHLGVACMLHLLKQNIGCKYAEYVSFITTMKQVAMDEVAYHREMNKFKDCSVLFLDDLLKGQTSDADKKYLYDLINHRYMRELPMIVSTEKTINQLLDYDEAIASRLIEMSGEYIVEFKNVPNKRLKGVNIHE